MVDGSGGGGWKVGCMQGQQKEEMAFRLVTITEVNNFFSLVKLGRFVNFFSPWFTKNNIVLFCLYTAPAFRWLSCLKVIETVFH